MNQYIWLISIVFIISIIMLSNPEVLAISNEYILLDDPLLLEQSLGQDYNLINVNLRLPEELINTFSSETRNQLKNLALLYATRDKIEIDKSVDFLENNNNGIVDDNYQLNIEKEEDEQTLSISPLPGVSVNANYNQNEEDNKIEKSTNISLNYWMNNKTMIRAEYDFEDKKGWNIADISLDEPGNEQNNEGDVANNIDFNNDTEAILNEEKNETSRLGILFKTNDYITISADYINQDKILDQDFSTVIGVEYRDEHGRVKYHYQVDFGDINTQESGLELDYKDLATFNASYKLLNPKLLEDQLKESIWDFGLDVNLNEISSISLGYQLKSEKAEEDIDQTDDKESNIKAQLKIKF